MPSFIVPARNNPVLTAACLTTLLHSVQQLNWPCQFILIDDESPPGENILEVFRQHRREAAGHEVKIIRSRKRQHYSGVFSIGLHHATRDPVFFISNDMLVTPAFLQALLAVAHRSSASCARHVQSHRQPPRAPSSPHSGTERLSRSRRV